MCVGFTYVHQDISMYSITMLNVYSGIEGTSYRMPGEKTDPKR